MCAWFEKKQRTQDSYSESTVRQPTLEGTSPCSHPRFRSSTIFEIFLKKDFGPVGDPFIDDTDR